jgi:hypothetical protein
MFVMIFVNDFWTIAGVPHWLEHAAGGEDFMGLADVVFPCFLFAVGMSIPFAIEGRYTKGFSGESTVGHILSRSFALLIMGVFIVNSEARVSPEAPYSIGVYWILMVVSFILVWNQYPKGGGKIYPILKGVGVLIMLYLAFTFRSTRGEVFSAGWWGILGSIGWSYLICAMIYVFTRDRLKYLLPVLGAFILICILGTRMNELHGGVPILNFPRPNFYNDFLGVLHIGSGTSVSLTMGGVVFTLLTTKYANVDWKKRLMWAAVAVVAFIVLGVVARNFWILSKIGGTPTWIFFIFAIAIAAYTVLSLLANRKWDGWLSIIKPAGTATLTCYLVPYLAYALSSITGLKLPDWFTHGIWGVVNCLCFALVVIGVTWVLGRMKIKLKI